MIKNTIGIANKAVIICSMILVSQCQDQTKSALSLYDLGKHSGESFELSSEIREISGLEMSKDNRLFAHNDERGIIYQLDLNSGNIIKKFIIGRFIKKSDFEGIAIAGDFFYLVTSNGKIAEFKEAGNRGSSPYELYHTGLNKKNNVEGLCYDPDTKCLLLACKGDAGKEFKNYKAVYAFSLETKKLIPEPRFLIKEKTILSQYNVDEFKPSGIAMHPLTGTYFILAAAGRIIVELSRDGKILDAQKLNHKIHEQPEGICFSTDYTMFISDEGKKHGKLTRYKINK